MRRLERIKRNVIRQAFVENVAVVEGRYLERGWNRPQRSGLGQQLLLVAVAAALFGVSYTLASLTDDRRAGERASRPAALPVAASPAGPPLSAEPEPIRTLAAPAPIDRSVLPLTVRRVVLDAGHGGASVGTRAPGGLIEKEVTLDIAQRLRRLLEGGAFEVVMTRDGDENITAWERADLANDVRADILVSIHVNWIVNRQVRGVETYYLGPTEDPYLVELAAEENRDSGYPLAEFRNLLERIYADVRHGESRKLARAVQRSLYRSLHEVNPGVENRGVKTAPFAVLVGSEMPAILAEVSCLSNEEEARRLGEPEYRQYIAEALYNGIQSYSEGLNRAQTQGG